MAENSTAELGAGTWTLDAAASSVGIQNKAMWGLATVKAAFPEVSGAGETLADGTGRGTLTVNAASVASGKSKLDVHLRSADFFDVETYPAFTFEADRVVPGAAGSAEVSGKLTILGKTQPLGFTARTSVTGPDEVTLSADVTVDRNAFGMTWNRGGAIKGLTSVALVLRFTRD